MDKPERLDTAKRHLEAGDYELARQELVKILRADPGNVAGWMLLVPLLQNPDQQADCYRRVLALDPNNRQAAQRLQALTQTSPADEKGLHCAQCGGAMKVHFEGPLRDKQALCPYCGAQVDLPDTYRRVERERQQKKRPWGSQTTERTVIETRSDGLDLPSLLSSLEPSSPVQQILAELKRRVEEQGGEIKVRVEEGTPHQVTLTTKGLEPADDAELSRRLQELGLDAEALKDLASGKQVTIQHITQETNTGLSFPYHKPDRPRDLGPESILAMAGGALPEEERRTCPECKATIPKHAPKCEWCGKQLYE